MWERSRSGWGLGCWGLCWLGLACGARARWRGSGWGRRWWRPWVRARVVCTQLSTDGWPTQTLLYASGCMDTYAHTHLLKHKCARKDTLNVHTKTRMLIHAVMCTLHCPQAVWRRAGAPRTRSATERAHCSRRSSCACCPTSGRPCPMARGSSHTQAVGLAVAAVIVVAGAIIVWAAPAVQPQAAPALWHGAALTHERWVSLWRLWLLLRVQSLCSSFVVVIVVVGGRCSCSCSICHTWAVLVLSKHGGGCWKLLSAHVWRDLNWE